MKHNAMIVGLAAAILLTLDGGALVRAAAEPTMDHCAGLPEAFLVPVSPLDTTGNRSPDPCWDAEGRIPTRPSANQVSAGVEVGEKAPSFARWSTMENKTKLVPVK